MRLSSSFLPHRLNPGRGDPKMTGGAPKSADVGARWPLPCFGEGKGRGLGNDRQGTLEPTLKHEGEIAEGREE